MTLREMRESWTINDLADAHEALDIMAEAEEFHARKAEKGK